MSAYYNEIDAYAAQWLRNLINKDLIAQGDVDERSICDVASTDLKAYRQCHFFAGIGGWSHALRLAGWPDDRPIWTGSCPCQPFSVAGKGAGADDPRHLWPHFHRLIAANRPPVVMGEQVAGKAGYGWFDGVRADLEGTGYSSRAADIPALAVNAPHIRQRLYWVALDVANAQSGGRGQGISNAGGMREGDGSQGPSGRPSQHGDAQPVHMANAPVIGREERERQDGQQDAGSGSQGWVDIAGAGADHMAHADDIGSSAQPFGNYRAVAGTLYDEKSAGDQSTICSTACSTNSSFWSDHIWLAGSDGKTRRSKPGLPLLAHGIPNRVGRLRAYGNAIVPPLAAEVIKAFMECEP